MIAALYVAKGGIYFGWDGVDPWDLERDARLYPGPYPVVAHPPCERWGNFAKGNPGAQRFKVGDDGGCFTAALDAVRRFGGVLEHPRGSKAWRHFRLPVPAGRGWSGIDAHGGRSCYVDQGAYGHVAKKPTWLYAVLPRFPRLDWTRVWGRPRIGGEGFHSAMERRRAKARSTYRPQPQIPKPMREATPASFARALIRMASSCEGWTPQSGPLQVPLAGGPR